MNNKKILKLLVASSTIVGGVGLTTNVVQATEVKNNNSEEGLAQNATKVSSQTIGKIINVNSNLNVRADAGINYDTIGYVCNNQEVEILSEKGDWYRISFNEREGYVSKKYVNIEGMTSENNTKTSNLKGKVVNVNSTLNIRQSTEANSAILGTLKNGDNFEIISKTGELYNIKSNNIIGFINEKYVQEITGNETTIDNVIETITEDYEPEQYDSNATMEKGKVVNISSNLRVRSSASASSEIIGYLLNGKEVTIKGEVSGWYNIDFNGKNGFVSKEYIQKNNEQDSQAPVVHTAETSRQGQVVNISSSLNIRSGAGTGYSVVGTLRNGATVGILEKSGDWYHINYNGVKGYIAAQYLRESNSNNGTPAISTEQTAVGVGIVKNISSSLNIRSGAGTGHSVVGTLTNGQAVNILGKEGDWYHINHDGLIGYVSYQYLQEVMSCIDVNEIPPIELSRTVSGTGKIVNISSSLNIRSGAGTGHSVIGTLRNGETVTVLGKEGDWYHISHSGITGYVSAQYLHEISSGDAPSETPSSGSTPSQVSGTGKVVNISSSLNIRSGAGTGHSVVGTLTNGTTVNILGKDGDWYHISHNGVTGYVSSQYLQEASTSSNVGGSSSSGNVSTSTSAGRVVNISSSLNIRSGAGTGHSVVGTLTNGATVSILGKSGDWYHISHNGVTGYVSAQYLQEVSSGSNVEGSTSSGNASTSTSGTGRVVNISSSLNIRSGAGTGYSVVGTLTNGATVSILGKSGDWYHISHNGVTGYVSAQYLQEGSSGSNTGAFSSGKGQVYNITNTLRVRSAASTNSTVLGYLLSGDIVDVISVSNGWVAINYKGRTAYVSADYIRDVSSNSSSSNSTAIFNEVYNVMKAHIGSPYVWGGSGEYLTTSSLNALKATFSGHNYSRAEQYVNQGYRAFDCSGLMQWGFKQVGISIGRTTYDQIYNGYEVSLSDLRPGDLLFYGNLSHVGMYIGNGQWIESPNSNANIRVVPVPWNKVTRARRVIG